MPRAQVEEQRRWRSRLVFADLQALRQPSGACAWDVHSSPREVVRRVATRADLRDRLSPAGVARWGQHHGRRGLLHGRADAAALIATRQHALELVEGGRDVLRHPLRAARAARRREFEAVPPACRRPERTDPWRAQAGAALLALPVAPLRRVPQHQHGLRPCRVPTVDTANTADPPPAAASIATANTTNTRATITSTPASSCLPSVTIAIDIAAPTVATAAARPRGGGGDSARFLWLGVRPVSSSESRPAAGEGGRCTVRRSGTPAVRGVLAVPTPGSGGQRRRLRGSLGALAAHTPPVNTPSSQDECDKLAWVDTASLRGQDPGGSRTKVDAALRSTPQLYQPPRALRSTPQLYPTIP
mmetsp:Transcript_63485/g.141574  ORF Transcript_63485/g.141574 Transcript_63485/m.141574 type:complete len:359 (-) Transcript_63485:182-1258(-)